MGILRTDKISGLETPTATTGSVFFDGNDHLEIGAAGDFNFLHNALSDWTAEFWVKTGSATRQFAFGTGASSAQHGFSIVVMSTDDNQADGTGVFAMFGRGSAGNYRYWGSNGGLTVDTWHHVAAVFKSSDKTLVLYVDGREVDSGTGTANGTFSTTDYSTSNSSFPFVVAENQHADTYLTGYISNLRVVSGRRLYTENFTPPVHALEPINGTRILCCNNPDSVTAFSSAGIGTVRTVATGGDPSVGTASTEFPGLTRDFTFGTEFKGVTTFDTQGYFVPPSGTTEQRGRGRGLFAAGDPGTTSINYITIASMGNAFEFGDLTEGRLGAGSAASSTRALFAGGFVSAANKDTIDFVTIATTGNAVSFGELVGTDRHEIGGASSSTRALFAGGSISASPNHTDEIDYVTIASLGDATDFGNLVLARRNTTGVMSPTRAVFCGGRNDTPSPSTQQEEMDYVTIATTGNALDFGDLTVARGRMGSVCSSTRGVIGGGEGSPADSNVIDYITIASTGNAQDFGDMITASEGNNGGCSNSLRGVFGGHDSPAGRNVLEYITISSTGNSQDFGDLKQDAARKTGCSDSHGGLS